MLSKKAQYALKATGYLATRFNGGPVQISEISERKKIPLKFLENILLELRKAGVLESKKGKGGGYYLLESPEKVSLAKIIRIVDGPISMLPCVSLHFYKKCADCEEDVCKINQVFIETRDATIGVLEHKTLNDIIEGVAKK
ncbi:transcriptional regulator [Flavipsychrobacter stenotrophus]|uniref:Transcriptional regulator n=1 Tax=Flavipsychrobacter stenotrophus TaxID=2077091 RepID=A0A2S7T1F2_9BACT|nr:Rrf2 family transcriptional regulator [Flavipsychrobacter stenotrophus]PQJ12758.1 transcriptional regulator [Flavipsychrobacter stenotrophus]